MVFATYKSSGAEAAAIADQLRVLLSKCRRVSKGSLSPWHEQQTHGHLVEALVRAGDAKRAGRALNAYVERNRGEALYWVEGLKSAIERSCVASAAGKEEMLHPEQRAMLLACRSFLATLRAPYGGTSHLVADGVQSEFLCRACAAEPGADRGARLCWSCAAGMDSVLATLPSRTLSESIACDACRQEITVMNEYFRFSLPETFRRSGTAQGKSKSARTTSGITYCRSCIAKCKAYHRRRSTKEK